MNMSFGALKARISEDRDDDRRSVGRRPVALEAEVRELGAHGIEAKVIEYFRA